MTDPNPTPDGALEQAAKPWPVGRRFEDRDSRAPGRVIRVGAETSPGEYAYQCIANPEAPNGVGRHGHVTAAALTRRYTELSHG